jgi:hypothetical protein
MILAIRHHQATASGAVPGSLTDPLSIAIPDPDHAADEETSL